MFKILIAVWVGITAAKFIAGLRKKDQVGDGGRSDTVVLEAKACPLCGVYGEQPCRNCAKT